MEKAVLIELQPNGIKMTTEKLMGGAFHKKIDEIVDIIRFDEDIFSNKEVSDEKMEDCINLLGYYKELANSRGITKIFAYASSIFQTANNSKKFFDNIFKKTNIFFNILTEEEEMRFIYNAMISTIDTVKGVLVYVNYHNTYIMNFAKRSLMNSYVLPYGSNSLIYAFKNQGTTKKIISSMQKYITGTINESKIQFEPFDEIKFVGAGPMFLTLSKLIRKMTHYPLNTDDNMWISNEQIDKAYSVLVEQGFDSTKRLAHVSNERLDNILSAVTIIKTFAEVRDIPAFNISARGITEAIISNKIVRESSCEGTPNDFLELSLKCTKYYYPVEDSNSDNVYNIAMELFHQMSIVHKLTRKQVKSLKIAAQLYDCGKRVTPINFTRFNKDVILNADLLNVSHKDLVTAAFGAQMQNFDNFNLSEWVKFKDIVSEEDLMNARKIGLLVALASALDAGKQNKIQELSCDLLGDIVIIKAKTDSNIDYEISEANKLSAIFKKVFNKSFQIM